MATTTSKAQMDAILTAITELRAEVSSLRQENAQLRSQPAPAAKPAASPVAQSQYKLLYGTIGNEKVVTLVGRKKTAYTTQGDVGPVTQVLKAMGSWRPSAVVVDGLEGEARTRFVEMAQPLMAKGWKFSFAKDEAPAQDTPAAASNPPWVAPAQAEAKDPFAEDPVLMEALAQLHLVERA